MREWFMLKRGGKGYIPAREASEEKYEVFGDFTKDHKCCMALVRGLNSGMIKTIKRKYIKR